MKTEKEKVLAVLARESHELDNHNDFVQGRWEGAVGAICPKGLRCFIIEDF